MHRMNLLTIRGYMVEERTCPLAIGGGTLLLISSLHSTNISTICKTVKESTFKHDYGINPITGYIPDFTLPL